MVVLDAIFKLCGMCLMILAGACMVMGLLSGLKDYWGIGPKKRDDDDSKGGQ